MGRLATAHWRMALGSAVTRHSRTLSPLAGTISLAASQVPTRPADLHLNVTFLTTTPGQLRASWTVRFPGLSQLLG